MSAKPQHEEKDICTTSTSALALQSSSVPVQYQVLLVVFRLLDKFSIWGELCSDGHSYIKSLVATVISLAGSFTAQQDRGAKSAHQMMQHTKWIVHAKYDLPAVDIESVDCASKAIGNGRYGSEREYRRDIDRLVSEFSVWLRSFPDWLVYSAEGSNSVNSIHPLSVQGGIV